MNFTILTHRNSVGAPAYSDRPSQHSTIVQQSFKKSKNDYPHLNPSKSKVNVRVSLNKSGEGISLSHPNLDNVRGSCLLNNPPKPYHHVSKESFIDQKYNKPNKQNHDMSVDLGARDSYYKFSSITPTSFLSEEDRKKSDSSYLRSSAKDPFILKLGEEKNQSKQQKSFEDIRSQILILTKKVFQNEEQISKMKDKKDKDNKKVYSLEHEFTQFQIQMFDICKKNTSHFSDFEDKIDKSNKMITEVKEKIANNNPSTRDKEDINKRIGLCQNKISQIYETIKIKEQNSIKNIANQLKYQQSLMKNFINEQVTDLRLKLDKNAKENNQVLLKLSFLEKQVGQKGWEDQAVTKDNKRVLNSMIIQRKQIITVKDCDSLSDKLKKNQNKFSLSKEKQFNFESKRQLLVKNNIYYIDSQGYLLDQNKYYLLNSKHEQILLPSYLISCLKQNNMLITPAAINKK